jgi:hypothetical protein
MYDSTHEHYDMIFRQNYFAARGRRMNSRPPADGWRISMLRMNVMDISKSASSVHVLKV